MGEIGKVIKVEDNKLTIKLKRTEACAKCRACTAGMASKDMIINAVNLCNASIDDNVEIVLEDNNFIKAVLIMYGIPLAGLMFGVLIGYFGSLKLGLGNNELIAFGLGIFFVVLTYLWIKYKEDYWKTKNFIPKAIRVDNKVN